MMKKLALLLGLASVATGAAAAEQVRLMLETNLQDPNPQVVSLRDAENCRYFGEFQPPADAKSDSWSIRVKRKTCQDGIVSTVSLVVPIRNLNTEPGYAAGSVLIAHATN